MKLAGLRTGYWGNLPSLLIYWSTCVHCTERATQTWPTLILLCLGLWQGRIRFDRPLYGKRPNFPLLEQPLPANLASQHEEQHEALPPGEFYNQVHLRLGDQATSWESTDFEGGQTIKGSPKKCLHPQLSSQLHCKLCQEFGNWGLQTNQEAALSLKQKKTRVFSQGQTTKAQRNEPGLPLASMLSYENWL